MNNTAQNPKAEQYINADKPRYTLSRDPNKAMQEMMITIDRLRSSLSEETLALKDADTKTFMDMQDKKLDIARDYVEGITQLIGRKDELKTASPALKNRLEDMRDDFAEIAYQNHAALERMQKGMKRLSDRIMETAREAAKKQEQIIYSASGHMQSGTKGSIGVNESA